MARRQRGGGSTSFRWGSSAIGLGLVHIGGIILYVSDRCQWRRGFSGRRVFSAVPVSDDPLVQLLVRDDRLVVLDDRADRALARHSSVVLMAGEAGIAKTVLLRAFWRGCLRGCSRCGECATH